MKMQVRDYFVLVCLFVFIWGTGCPGDSRKVRDCYDCYQDEYCVYGEAYQIYCANSCLGDINCDLDHWCVPLEDQGTPGAQSGVLRWVCMPERFYDDFDGTVWRSYYDCEPGGMYECPYDMTCLYDTEYPSSVFFCSDECYYHSDCLTDCCYDTGDEFYCAPYLYCD